MADLGTMAIGTVVDVGKTVGGAFLNDYFNQRSESRADARNRSLIRDTPKLQQEGRRASGLNPYGEGSQLPGMSAQSQTEVPTGFNTLADIMAMERLKLDELSVNADKNLKDSQAGYYKALEDATRGGEERAGELHGFNIQQLVAKINNTELKNRVLLVDAELAEYTKDNEMLLSDEELMQAYNLTLQQEYNIMLSDLSMDEKKAQIEVLNRQAVYFSAQSELARAGVELTNAQVQEVWQKISTMSSEELLNYAKTDVERESLKEIKARVEQINAETKEIPANARVARNQKRFQNVFGGIQAGLSIFGAIATGGASAAAGSLIKPADVTSASPGLLDGFGNPIR